MKKIAFFGISTHLGGAEKSLLHFLQDTQKKKPFLPVVVLPKAQGPLVTQLKAMGISPLVIDLPPEFLQLSRRYSLLNFFFPILTLWQFLRAYKRIRQFLSHHNFDVIHTTGLKLHILLGLYGLRHYQKICIHVRDIFTNPLLIFFFRRLQKRKNIFWISNSKATAASLGPIPSKVIYNGFDGDDFPKRSDEDLRSELSIPDQAPVVGIVGAIARWKGQREFIEMALRLHTPYPHLYFLVVGSEIYDTTGDQGELQRLQQQVRAANLTHRVLFVPFQKDVAKAYQALDVLVHASIRPEPFGRVLVEAMICGRPVVASNQGGPLEIVDNGSNGWLYRQGDVADMAEKIGRLIEDPQERLRFGNQAKNIGDKFSPQKTHHELSAYLQSL